MCLKFRVFCSHVSCSSEFGSFTDAEGVQHNGQEYLSPSEIQAYLDSNGYSFPVFAKVKVNGPHANRLFKRLRRAFGFQTLEWNFEKFLLTAEGKPYARYEGATDPMDMVEDIENLLSLQ